MFEERECTKVDEALLNNTYESLAELTPGMETSNQLERKLLHR